MCSKSDKRFDVKVAKAHIMKTKTSKTLFSITKMILNTDMLTVPKRKIV